MREFVLIVRQKLGRLPLEPARAHEITAELAHQLEDKFQEGIDRGLPEARALADALAQFGDWREVRRGILAAETGETMLWPSPNAISRRVAWAALAAVALLCLLPTFRQAMRAAPEAWSLSSSPLSERALRNLADRGVAENDAQLVAFAAMHLDDMTAAAHYAEQAITMDPKLTWIGIRFASPVNQRPDSTAWIARLRAWDPGNAVPCLLEADLLYTRSPEDGSLDPAAPARLARDTAWGEKMHTAFAAPRFDSYGQRLYDLNRSVVERVEGTRANALVWYSARLFTNLSQVASYGGYVTRKLGPEAEAAGRNADAAALYWSVARFGERVANAGLWEWEAMAGENIEAPAYASLASLAARTGTKEEAAALAALSQRIERIRAQRREDWEKRSADRWGFVQRPALLAWASAGIVLLSGLACLAWIAMLGFRSEERSMVGWRGTVALALSYAPPALLVTSLAMYFAMLPYLRSTQDFATAPQLFYALAPFWFNFWIGPDMFGGAWRMYAGQLMLPGLLAVAVLISGIALLRWVSRHRAGQTPQAS
jgi:hypothetical protein